MDGQQFDWFVRSFATRASRRSLLKGLIGLGGASAGGILPTPGVDARSISTRPTVPPPAKPTIPTTTTCPPGESACGSTCCPEDACRRDGTCCDVPGDVVCTGGLVCCSAGTCARSGNADFCCDGQDGHGSFPCGLECCPTSEQCCDRECCNATHTCLTRVFPEGPFVQEEVCCPTHLTCDDRCCDGACFDPSSTFVFEPISPTSAPQPARPGLTCCPAGRVVCRNEGLGTPTCIDPAYQCCNNPDCPQLTASGNEACWACIANTCVAVAQGGTGDCPDCQVCDGSHECVADTDANEAQCGVSPDHICCDGRCEPASGSSCAGSTCPAGTCGGLETCCPLSAGQWGCCPYPEAICCGVGSHCCPSTLPICCPGSEGCCESGMICCNGACQDANQPCEAPTTTTEQPTTTTSPPAWVCPGASELPLASVFEAIKGICRENFPTDDEAFAECVLASACWESWDCSEGVTPAPPNILAQIITNCSRIYPTAPALFADCVYDAMCAGEPEAIPAVETNVTSPTTSTTTSEPEMTTFPPDPATTTEAPEP